MSRLSSSKCQASLVHAFLALGAALLSGCGSSSQPPLPPAQDFTITVSPSSLTQQAGGAASTFTVSVTGQNGFTGPVSISLSGLPAASATSPASAFTIAAGASQTVTLSVPASVAAGNFTLMAKGTSGTLTHSAPLPLIVTPARDFALSLSAAQVATTLGATTPSVSVSIAALNGFTGTVTLTLSGFPPGVTSQPAGPFVLADGQSQAVTLSVPASSAIGIFS